MWPVLRCCTQARVNRAEVDQIAVPGKVSLIPDLMFPIAALPDAFFPPLDLRQRAMGRHRLAAREFGFQHADTGGVICVALGQCPDGVDYRRQDGDGINVKGITCHRIAHRPAQVSNVAGQQVAAPVRKADGEKESAAGAAFANIVGHGETLARAWLTRT